MSVHPAPADAELTAVVAGGNSILPLTEDELAMGETSSSREYSPPKPSRISGVQSESSIGMPPPLKSTPSKWGAVKAAVETKQDNERDVVMMKTRQLDASEATQFIKISVLRLGKLHGRISVAYRTSSHTAKAGDDFVACAGELVFEPGDAEKEILVEVIDSSGWEPIEV